MTDIDDLLRARELLEAAGLRVERVPEGRTKRCDLRAQDDEERYLIEVKGVHDDAAIAKALRNDGVCEASRRISPRGNLCQKIDAAVKQLEATKSKVDDELLLLAFVGRAFFWSNVLVPRVIGALYGARSIVDLTTPPKAVGKCLYFSRSAFLEHPVYLDAAIILDNSGARMCVNDHSDRAQRVRDSRLGRHFSGYGALHEAATLERAGGFLVADCDIDHRDEHAVLRYLANKYNLKRPVALCSHAWVGAMLIPA